MDADVKRLDASFLQTSPKAGPTKKLMHSSNLKHSTVPSGMIFFLQARLQLPVLPLELVTPYTGFCRISDIMKQGLVHQDYLMSPGKKDQLATGSKYFQAGNDSAQKFW